MAEGREVEGSASRPSSSPPSHGELFRVFVKISLLGFGGPNAHLALMLDEVVERRGWVDREHFLHLVGVTNLLPGPNSSEVAIHVGYTQRRWTGALATGLAFLLPTFVMVTALAWLYFGYGTLPGFEPVFWALKPAVVALIVWAGIKLGRAALSGPLAWGLAAAGAALAVMAGPWAVGGMVAGGLVTWGAWRFRGSGAADVSGKGAAAARSESDPGAGDADGRSGIVLLPFLQGGAQGAAAAGLLGGLGAAAAVLWTHLWIGAVLFGGGYVLVALLEPWAVGRYGWLTAGQFLDGVALTQAVPGPISTLAAFVGYAAAGLPGAVAGTVGIYLPAFAAVLLVAPHLERLREVEAVKAALSGVNAVVVGVILGVALTLLSAAVVDAGTAVIGILALAALLSGRVSGAWVVLAALVVGVVRAFLVG